MAVSAGLNEKTNHSNIAPCRRPEQRKEAMLLVDLDLASVGPGPEQRLDDADVAVLRCLERQKIKTGRGTKTKVKKVAVVVAAEATEATVAGVRVEAAVAAAAPTAAAIAAVTTAKAPAQWRKQRGW